MMGMALHLIAHQHMQTFFWLILVLRATSAGGTQSKGLGSYRLVQYKKQHCTFLIQVLGAALTANAATHDLDSIMTRVAKVVATEYISNSKYEQWNEKKQIPFVYSTLTAKVYFSPK